MFANSLRIGGAVRVICRGRVNPHRQTYQNSAALGGRAHAWSLRMPRNRCPQRHLAEAVPMSTHMDPVQHVVMTGAARDLPPQLDPAISTAALLVSVCSLSGCSL